MNTDTRTTIQRLRASAIEAIDLWNKQVTDHPLSLANKELQAACEKAEDAMQEAYRIAAAQFPP